MFNVPFLTQMPSVLSPSVHLEGWESLQVTWGSWWGPVGTESNLSALLLQVTKSALVSLVGKLHFPYISINETLKKGQTLTIIRETWVWIGKALYFFISQCRIYGVFSSAEWNHPCKVCGNLDVRDAIISSRKNSEFFQLECAEFGEFHIHHSSKRHLCLFWMSHFLICLCCCTRHSGENLQNSYCRIILEWKEFSSFFHFKLSKFFLILFLRNYVIIIIIICFIIHYLLSKKY